MEKGWVAYCGWFPDYSIKVADILSRGNVVGLFETSQGTCCVNGELLPRNHWEIPAAWKAVVQGAFLSGAYADKEPVWEIIGSEAILTNFKRDSNSVTISLSAGSTHHAVTN